VGFVLAAGVYIGREVYRKYKTDKTFHDIMGRHKWDYLD